VEYPQRNERNSTARQEAEDIDMRDVVRALTALQKKITSMLSLIEKDLYNIYSTDVQFIEFVDKEIMKKILEFERDMKKIVVYSKEMQITHEVQGRLFYD
jgi:inactivated superfamily I helicase